MKHAWGGEGGGGYQGRALFAIGASADLPGEGSWGEGRRKGKETPDCGRSKLLLQGEVEGERARQGVPFKQEKPNPAINHGAL